MRNYGEWRSDGSDLVPIVDCRNCSQTAKRMARASAASNPMLANRNYHNDALCNLCRTGSCRRVQPNNPSIGRLHNSNRRTETSLSSTTTRDAQSATPFTPFRVGSQGPPRDTDPVHQSTRRQSSKPYLRLDHSLMSADQRVPVPPRSRVDALRRT